MVLSGFAAIWKRRDILTLTLALLLVAAFLFGGASRLNALRLAVVELASLPLLVIAASRLMKNSSVFQDHKFALGLLGATVALPLVQLIPLPPGLWTQLPGRAEMVMALDIVGLEPGWTSLSLTPTETWNAALALLPPVAAFLGLMASQSQRMALRIVYAVLGFGMTSILIGAAQLASGDQRFYAWTTTGAGFIVGLFANRNHFATLMLICLPYATLIAASQIVRRPDQRHVWIMGVVAAYAVIGLTVGAAQSRAGILLFLPTLTISILMGWRAAKFGSPRPLALGAGAAVLVSAIVAAALLLPQLLDRFETAQATEARFERWPIAAQAAGPYLPVGAGVGSFDPIFRTVEPLKELDATYFNHAHNEYLEIWIESGWMGAALLILFAYWFGRRSIDAWFHSKQPDRSLRRAASIAILVILAHSFVDYPLRTSVLAIVMAVSAAILEGLTTQDYSPSRRSRRLAR
ncbi:MAG: O-antigen ligase domain-containing protein [Brevundimonas sp.]|nr:MAG: O-antigen ligase domain-containing protein [Brevundimonas sp.]